MTPSHQLRKMSFYRKEEKEYCKEKKKGSVNDGPRAEKPLLLTFSKRRDERPSFRLEKDVSRNNP